MSIGIDNHLSLFSFYGMTPSHTTLVDKYERKWDSPRRRVANEVNKVNRPCPCLLRGALEKIGELAKILWVEVRDGPKAHSSIIKTHGVVALESRGSNGVFLVFCGRPDKNVDDMLPVTVDNRRNWPSAKIVKARAN
jgi:hypothetical protein